MSINFDLNLDNSIKVISSIDTAVVSDEDAYEKYIESFQNGEPDESLLELNGDPHRFVVKTILPYAQQSKIENDQVKITKGVVQPQMGNLINETVKYSLCDIVNPSDLPVDKHVNWAKDAKRGGTDDKIMAVLVSKGIAKELYTARDHALKNNGVANLEKK
jgi:hypothetical protein